jgi:hypothetical protein
LLFGIPVLSLARNYYESTGLTERLLDPADMGEAIVGLLTQQPPFGVEEWDRRLACLVAAEIETTVPEDDTSHAESLQLVDSLLRMKATCLEQKHVAEADRKGAKAAGMRVGCAVEDEIRHEVVADPYVARDVSKTGS